MEFYGNLGCCIKTPWINSLVKVSNCKKSSSSSDLSTRHVGLKGAFVWHKLVGKTGTAHGQLKKLRYGQLCQHSDADWCSSPQQKETPSESFPHNCLWHYTRWCPAGNYISIPRSGEFYEFSYPALAPLCWFAGSQIVLNSWNISPCQVESEIHPT